MATSKNACGQRYLCTTNQDYFVPSVYHPTTFDYYETAFIEFLVNSWESILATSPNARLTAGDINKLDLKSLTCTQQSGLSKQVTRKVCTSKNVTKSDHSSAFIFPKVGNPPVRSVVEFIDARSDHHKS